MSSSLSWFIFFSLSFTFSPTAASLPDDAMSLLMFKSSISFGASDVLRGWNLSVSHCDWFGVTCDNGGTRRVVALNISGSTGGVMAEGSFLAGTLNPSIGNLVELRVLSLPNNLMYGEIPGTVGKLQSLEILELQGNNFSGEIPSQISSLPSLRLLNLSDNSVSGSIPSKLIGSAKLEVIDLSYNQLSGNIQVVGNRCGVLNHLRLSHNFLTGNIPAEIGQCWKLRTLLLDGNILEGKIPAEIGQMSELRILDVSRNSLTDSIPKELGNCRKLSQIVLTNLNDINPDNDSVRGEFNAFNGGIPSGLLLLPSLQVLWAPRGNFNGRLPINWNSLCSLRVLNLGQNYITGTIPESIRKCANLTYLDLSSNKFQGNLPSQLRVSCMAYFNVSQNKISGVLPRFEKDSFCTNLIPMFSDQEDDWNSYLNFPVWDFTRLKDNLLISHDFSWNRFSGSLVSVKVGEELLANGIKFSYKLLLNSNNFNGSLPIDLISHCNNMKGVSVNLSSNLVSGEISDAFFLHCRQLIEFEAASNELDNSIGTRIGELQMLLRLDLRGNRLYGVLPDQLGNLQNLKWMLLGGNNLTGEIPSRLSRLTSLLSLDLSRNLFTGIIPDSLSYASRLEILLLDHNRLTGEIPASFSVLSHLTKLDVSFNNLSGHIPRLHHTFDCIYFGGNKFLHPCPDSYSDSPAGLPVPLDVEKWKRRRKFLSMVIAVAASSTLICLLLMIAVIIIVKRRLGKQNRLKKKQVVTFSDAPSDLNYDNVVRATENFSLRYLIGTGGFGSTYKAELPSGFLVAVKRLSIGRFQGGIQQFDAEIRTLGRIRHKNLVTLLGYYVGEAEMFLVYNYLSGGNLETFIHEKSCKHVKHSVIHKIALDIARALAYLHYSCDPRIVHRDIKPSNILLDEDHNTYISDFGLARLLEISETHATTDVAGTFGYVAPEYATTCRVSDKADVYSFGVVLLELLSGKRSLDRSFSDFGNGFNIVTWANMLIKEGRSSELFTPELREMGPKEHLLGMLKLASNCTVEILALRPSMKQVVETLKQL
ncbi:hypothetical protein IC582_021668 [Cucumis melo]